MTDDIATKARALAEAVLRLGGAFPDESPMPKNCGCLTCQARSLLAALDAEPTSWNEDPGPVAVTTQRIELHRELDERFRVCADFERFVHAEPTAASEEDFEHLCRHGIGTIWHRGNTVGGTYCGKCHDSAPLPRSRNALAEQLGSHAATLRHPRCTKRENDIADDCEEAARALRSPDPETLARALYAFDASEEASRG